LYNGKNSKINFWLFPWNIVRNIPSQGVKANVQLKSSISIGAKVEITPKDFTLGVKAEFFFFNFNLPQVTNR
jgi:hypothetical protein